MPDNHAGTLETLAIHLAKVFYPLKERIMDEEILLLLAELGIKFPTSLVHDPDFQKAVEEVTDKIEEMIVIVEVLVKAIDEDNSPLVANKSNDLMLLLRSMEQHLKTIAIEIDKHKPYQGISQAKLNAYLERLVENVIDYLLVNYLQSTVPLFAMILEFLGIIEVEPENEGSTNPLEPEYIRKNIRPERIQKLLDYPAGLAYEVYDWGNDAVFTGDKLFKKLEKLFTQMELTAEYDSSGGHPKLNLAKGSLNSRLSLTPKGISYTIKEIIKKNFNKTINKEKWSLEFSSGAELEAESGVLLQAPTAITLEPPIGSSSKIFGCASIKWIARNNDTEQPLLLFGAYESSRLETREVFVSLATDLTCNTGSKKSTGNIKCETELIDGKLVIKPDELDGFLAEIFPSEGLGVNFSVKLRVDHKKGLYFKGSGTLDYDMPTSISLGPIEIPNLTFGISTNSLGLEIGADIKTKLGPFTAIVENIGMATTLKFPEDRNENLGLLGFKVGFKPPIGVGLALNAGIVKGGGYLALDYDKEQYSGAFELDFNGIIGFTALGIITTKFADGSEGYSLLLLINVNFNKPVALGFNFYLSAIGGIIGLHRTMACHALQTGIKDRSVDNILFPENAVENINKIISDLDAIFPAKQDQFVLGIMARITWNTPAILTIDASLVVEFPSPVKTVILGVVKCVLPSPDKAIIVFNVAFVGIIDFDNKILMFDAAVFDSSIFSVTLAGDMALRISWGNEPDFLVSVGGFHPIYAPPAHLKLIALKRITLNLLNGNPNLVLRSYFAVTTNTVQFGASLDFTYRIAKFGVFGNFGFDTLIQYSPFHFIAVINASVEVKLGRSSLFVVGLQFNLDGPAPWHASGYASFKIFFVKFKVRFNKTWGEKRESLLPSIAVLPLLIQEFTKDENWNANEGAGAIELLTYADNVANDNAVLVKPYGSLEVDQKVVPLDVTMDKFGNYKPDDISKAVIKRVAIGGVNQSTQYMAHLQNLFAPAAFKNLTDQDKLTAPSYEEQKSGVRVSSTDNITFDCGVNRIVEYEAIISDHDEEELGLLQFNSFFVKSFVSGGDVGRSPLSNKLKNAKVRADKTVSISEEKYTVVSALNLKNIAGTKVFNSKTEADEFLKDTIKKDPSKQGKLLLSPAFQLA